MKKIFAIIFVLAIAFFVNTQSAEAVTKVKSYYRKNGTYVNSYYRSDSNRYKYDNYSTKGNYNPYTGKKGYKKLY